ncbi:hypothetical protein L7F22_011103 [Adiantum nelumboides]|nr:hypothetical protein [Adiantum nelumboides]
MSGTCSSASATPMLVELAEPEPKMVSLKSSDGDQLFEVELESEPEPKKMVTLQSSDGELFEVELDVALLSRTIKNMIDVEDLDDCTSAPLPLVNVSSAELVRVLEFCRYHVEQHEQRRPPGPADGVDAAGRRQQISSSKKEIEEWNAQFLLSLDQLRPDVYDLLLAASYLDIQSLVDLTSRHIGNDFTRGEAAIKRKNEWAYTDQ